MKSPHLTFSQWRLEECCVQEVQFRCRGPVVERRRLSSIAQSARGDSEYFPGNGVSDVNGMLLDDVNTEHRRSSFAEMPTSSFVESGFWCFDSLFVPQQHPAREVQDTFYLSGISTIVSSPLQLISVLYRSFDFLRSPCRLLC